MRMNIGSGELHLSLRTGLGRALAILREDRAMTRAARRMPKPVPWDWAKSRLVPLLAGPMIDPEGVNLVRSIMDPGAAVVFGIDLGKAFPLVDEAVARRWECTPEQIQAAAVDNLGRWAERLEPTVVRTATMSGHRIRMVQHRPSWTSSLLLVGRDLRRLFRSHDQVFLAPRRDTLLSFSTDIPERLVGDIVDEFEADAAYPLLLGPFALLDGVLVWGGAEDWDDELS